MEIEDSSSEKTAVYKRQNPFFSILLPVYNDENFIGTCIESILSQSFSNFELIICDDASTDQTPAILQKYAQKDFRISLIVHEENRKALIARNDLVRKASGRYCIFVDGDDEILPEFFMRAWNILNKKHYDIIQFSYEWNGTGIRNRTLADQHSGDFPSKELSGREILHNYLYGFPRMFAPWAKTYSRILLLKSLPEDHYQEIVDDIQLTLRAASFATSYLSVSGNKVYRYNYGVGEFGRPSWSIAKFNKYCKVLSGIIQDSNCFLKRAHIDDSYADKLKKILIPDFLTISTKGWILRKDLTHALKIYLQYFEDRNLFDEAFIINKDTSISEFLRAVTMFLKMFLSRWFLRICGKKGLFES